MIAFKGNCLSTSLFVVCQEGICAESIPEKYNHKKIFPKIRGPLLIDYFFLWKSTIPHFEGKHQVSDYNLFRDFFYLNLSLSTCGLPWFSFSKSKSYDNLSHIFPSFICWIYNENAFSIFFINVAITFYYVRQQKVSVCHLTIAVIVISEFQCKISIS